jgi:RNA polymerase sigma-70 factor (ECF subfamily)
MAEIPRTRASLLVRIRDPHDEGAWAEFVGIYEPVLYRVARQRGFQDADARELTQEVFIAVASAIDRWQLDPNRGRFRTWLFRIARNLSINLLVSRRRHPQGTGSTDIQALLDQQPGPPAEDSNLFDAEYKRELFGRAASRVRDQFREATWQAFWRTSVEAEEVPVVARALGMSAGAVYIARSRVMARLREEVERLQGQQGDGHGG